MLTFLELEPHEQPLLGLAYFTFTQAVLQEVISVVGCCFLPGRLTLAEAAEAGAVTHTVLFSELPNHCPEQLSTHKKIYGIIPSSTGWDVKCEACDVVSGNTWSSVVLILFHVPGVFTSKLLRGLQKGKSELEFFADVHGRLVFFWGREASISKGYLSWLLLHYLFIGGLLI